MLWKIFNMRNFKKQRNSKGKLISAYGECEDCGKVFKSKNAVAVAARHTDSTGHTTWVETNYSTRFFIGIDNNIPPGQTTIFENN